jgi:hypothetical protein
VGLALEEGQQLLRLAQMEIITAQARGYELCRRPCVDCGQRRHIKDVRAKCVQTIFGELAGFIWDIGRQVPIH